MGEKANLESGDEFARMLAEHEGASGKLAPGQKISGRIITISGDDVFLDVGVKEDGVMDRRDIIDGDGKETAGPGDVVEAYIVSISSQGVKLSRSMDGAGLYALEEAKDAHIPVAGRVIGACKGGYRVEVMGKTAFCPGSQMRQSEAGKDLAGEKMDFLITRIENHGRNIVVSHRALVEREREENIEKLKDNFSVGDVIEGKITRIMPFGVFVELLPAVEGMIHLSELAWNRVEKPEDVVAQGEEVKVKILEIGQDSKGRPRISLSRKQAMEDPWNTLRSTLKIGDIVDGTVVRIAPFGAFVEIFPGVDGLIHLSELSWEKRINNAGEVVSPNDKVKVKVKDINWDDKKISLSLKDAQGDPWSEASEKFAPGTKVLGTVESKSPYGLFIALAPGITGLLPAGAIKNAESTSILEKLNPGDKINIVVQKVDCGARRISLMPEGNQNSEDEKSWRDHAKSETVSSAQTGGIMAQALQKAMKKKQGDKKA